MQRIQSSENLWNKNKKNALAIFFSNEDVLEVLAREKTDPKRKEIEQFIKNGWNVFLNTTIEFSNSSRTLIEDASNILDLFRILFKKSSDKEIPKNITDKELSTIQKTLKDFIEYCTLWNDSIFADIEKQKEISEDELKSKLNSLFEHKNWERMISLALILKRETYRDHYISIPKFVSRMLNLFNLPIEKVEELRNKTSGEVIIEIRKHVKIKELTEEEKKEKILQDKIDEEIKLRKANFSAEEKSRMETEEKEVEERKKFLEKIKKSEEEKKLQEEKIKRQKEAAANQKLKKQLPLLFKDFFEKNSALEYSEVFYQLNKLLTNSLSEEWRENSLKRVVTFFYYYLARILDELAKKYNLDVSNISGLPCVLEVPLELIKGEFCEHLKLKLSLTNDYLSSRLDLKTNIVSNLIKEIQLNSIDKLKNILSSNLDKEIEKQFSYVCDLIKNDFRNRNEYIEKETRKSSNILMKFEHYLAISDKMIAKKYSELETNQGKKGTKYNETIKSKSNLLNKIFEKADQDAAMKLKMYQDTLTAYQNAAHIKKSVFEERHQLSTTFIELKKYMLATTKLKTYDENASYTFTDVEILIAIATQSVFMTKEEKIREFEKIECIFNHVMKQAEEALQHYKHNRSFAKDVKTWIINASHSFFKEPANVPTETAVEDVLKNLKQIFIGTKQAFLNETKQQETIENRKARR